MNRAFPQIRSVIITVKDHSTKYTVFKSLRKIRNFLQDLTDATEDGIVIEGSSSPHKVEEAVRIVYTNIIASLPAGEARKQFAVLALWEMQKQLYESSIDSAIYCLNELHKIAPTAFEKARLLLCSQCDQNFIPLATADWKIIGNAIQLLKKEKNGETAAARDLLQTLKDTGSY
jgi:hypothetical protein